jgi:hypothetical protein
MLAVKSALLVASMHPGSCHTTQMMLDPSTTAISVNSISGSLSSAHLMLVENLSVKTAYIPRTFVTLTVGGQYAPDFRLAYENYMYIGNCEMSDALDGQPPNSPPVTCHVFEVSND